VGIHQLLVVQNCKQHHGLAKKLLILNSDSSLAICHATPDHNRKEKQPNNVLRCMDVIFGFDDKSIMARSVID